MDLIDIFDVIVFSSLVIFMYLCTRITKGNKMLIKQIAFGIIVVMSLYNGIDIHRSWINGAIYDNVWFYVCGLSMILFIEETKKDIGLNTVDSLKKVIHEAPYKQLSETRKKQRRRLYNDEKEYF